MPRHQPPTAMHTPTHFHKLKPASAIDNHATYINYTIYYDSSIISWFKVRHTIKVHVQLFAPFNEVNAQKGCTTLLHEMYKRITLKTKLSFWSFNNSKNSIREAAEKHSNASIQSEKDWKNSSFKPETKFYNPYKCEHSSLSINKRWDIKDVLKIILFTVDLFIYFLRSNFSINNKA